MHRKAAWRVLACCAALAGCGRGAPVDAADGAAGRAAAADVREVSGATVVAFAGLDGEARMRSLGCGACHAGEGPRVGATPLAPSEGPRDPAALFVYLSDSLPAPPRADGARMPAFHLTRAEALALALHLGRGSGSGEARARLDRARDDFADIDAADGAVLYAALRCGGCHSADAPPPDAPPLALEGARATRDWLRAFLLRPHAVRPFGTRPGTGARMPDFALSDDDVDAIVATLTARTIDLPAFAAAPPTPFAAAKIETLLRERYDCLGCHAWNGEGGRIGPDLARARERLQPAYIRAMLETPELLVPGTMMPRSRLPAAERAALAAFLATYAGGEDASLLYLSLLDHATATATARATATATGNVSGAVIYRHRCAACHGGAGGGDGFNAAYLDVQPTAHASGEDMGRRPDDTLYDGIAAGGRILGRSARMPAFGATLTAQEIRALVAHIRDLCDCAPPAWSADGNE